MDQMAYFHRPVYESPLEMNMSRPLSNCISVPKTFSNENVLNQMLFAFEICIMIRNNSMMYKRISTCIEMRTNCNSLDGNTADRSLTHQLFNLKTVLRDKTSINGFIPLAFTFLLIWITYRVCISRTKIYALQYIGNRLPK